MTQPPPDDLAGNASLDLTVPLTPSASPSDPCQQIISAMTLMGHGLISDLRRAYVQMIVTLMTVVLLTMVGVALVIAGAVHLGVALSQALGL